MGKGDLANIKNPASAFIGSKPERKAKPPEDHSSQTKPEQKEQLSDISDTDRTYRIESRCAEVEQMYMLPEVEKILNVSGRTILTYIYSGRLKAVKIGRKWRISETSLDTFLGR